MKNKYFAGMVICAFISVISFFQINGYKVDQHNLNWLCILIGVLFAGATIYFGKKV
jgi:hypothetical protein